MNMSLNNTEITINPPSLTFHCPHMPNFIWDLSRSTLYWTVDAIVLIASPAIILLNVLTVIVMKRSKELKKTSNILLSSLAVTDLLVGVIVMPLSATVDILILTETSFEHTCMLDIVNVSFMFLLLATLHHLTIIAWERYVAIQKWMDYKVIVTRRRLKNLALAGWLFALFQAVPGTIMTIVGVDHGIVQGWYTWCASMGAVCLILIAFFYRKVYLGIRNRNINEISQVTVIMKAKLESKVAMTTAMLTAALMFAFVPVITCELLGNFFPVLHTSVALRFTDTMVQLNSLFNPLLYCYRDRRFRNALRDMFGKRKKPQALQPAVDVARVRQKDPQASKEQQTTDIQSRRLTRSASCNLPEALSSVQGRSRKEVLKRSWSVPTLHTCSISSDNSDQQQTSSILAQGKRFPGEGSFQRKAMERNPESSNDNIGNNPQDKT